MAIETNAATAAQTSAADFWANKVQQGPDEQSNSTLFADLVSASQLDTSGTGELTSQTLAEEAAKSEATEDRFLTLLLAQMNNQDPLNPLENAEITTQLAQISTVSGIEGLNKTMSDLLEKIGGASPVDSASMIDRKVLVAGDSLTSTGGVDQKIQAGGELAASSTNVAVQIFGKDGEAVREFALGPQAAGLVTFEWDGLDQDGDELPAGDYKFQVLGQTEGQALVAAPMAASTVTGVTRSGETLSYRLANGTTIPADQVNGVF